MGQSCFRLLFLMFCSHVLKWFVVKEIWGWRTLSCEFWRFTAVEEFDYDWVLARSWDKLLQTVPLGRVFYISYRTKAAPRWPSILHISSDTVSRIFTWVINMKYAAASVYLLCDFGDLKLECVRITLLQITWAQMLCNVLNQHVVLTTRPIAAY